MGVYSRFKKAPEGFRALVELLESTPKSRRDKMIEVGLAEDPEYTRLAQQYMITFEDVLNMTEMELAELLATVHPRIAGISICQQSKEVQTRFLRSCPPRSLGELREQFEFPPTALREIGGAQLKMIETTRKLEKKGALPIKRIPHMP